MRKGKFLEVLSKTIVEIVSVQNVFTVRNCLYFFKFLAKQHLKLSVFKTAPLLFDKLFRIDKFTFLNQIVLCCKRLVGKGFYLKHHLAKRKMCQDFILRERKKLRFFNSFARVDVKIIIWREISREAILNFLPKKLSGETLCKFFQIFPPKVLVYRGNIFSSHLFN